MEVEVAQELGEKFGYKVQVMGTNSFLVTSKYSEWHIIYQWDYYLLKHRSNGNKVVFHTQKDRKGRKLRFLNLEKVFIYIHNHDRAEINKKNGLPIHIEKLFAIIEKQKTIS